LRCRRHKRNGLVLRDAGGAHNDSEKWENKQTWRLRRPKGVSRSYDDFDRLCIGRGFVPTNGCLSSILRPICQCQPVFLFWLRGRAVRRHKMTYAREKRGYIFFFLFYIPFLTVPRVAIKSKRCFPSRQQRCGRASTTILLLSGMTARVLRYTCAGLVVSRPRNGANERRTRNLFAVTKSFELPL